MGVRKRFRLVSPSFQPVSKYIVEQSQTSRKVVYLALDMNSDIQLVAGSAGD